MRDHILRSFGFVWRWPKGQQHGQGEICKWRNVIYDRVHKFNNRSWESVDTFVTSLYGLALYGLAETIVAMGGCMMKNWSWTGLLLEYETWSYQKSFNWTQNCTLDKAWPKCTSPKLFENNLYYVRGESQSTRSGSFPVGAILHRKYGSGRKTSGADRPRQNRFTITHTAPSSGKPCSRCGKTPSHKVKFCLTRNAKCNK